MTKLTSIFDEVPDLKYREEQAPVSHEVFGNVVNNRRSVRVYTQEKIPPEVVNQVLDWALLAPNSSNLQCWEFLWVKDPVKKTRLIKALMGQPAAATAPELIVAVAKFNTWKKNRRQMLQVLEKQADVPASAWTYYEKLVPLVYTIGPFGIVGWAKKFPLFIAGLFRPVPRQPTSMADLRVWAVKSTALACQNIMLGFSSFGFDTCPMEGFDSVRVKKILGLKRTDEVVMCISAGKRSKRGVYGPRIRMPREQFIKTV